MVPYLLHCTAAATLMPDARCEYTFEYTWCMETANSVGATAVTLSHPCPAAVPMGRQGLAAAARAHSMLALQVGVAAGARCIRVFRPATGRTPKQLTLQELRAQVRSRI